MRALHSLSCAKYKVLLKEPAGRTISKSDKFKLNIDFTDKSRRIKVPLPPFLIFGCLVKCLISSQINCLLFSLICHVLHHTFNSGVDWCHICFEKHVRVISDVLHKGLKMLPPIFHIPGLNDPPSSMC